MNGIKIGNRIVPIIRDVVLTGRPPSSRPSWSTMLQYFEPVPDYELGIVVGDYDNPINAQHGPITQGLYISGGTTSIDDGGTLEAEIIENTSTYPGFSLKVHTNRNGTTDYKESATVTIIPGFNGYTSYHDIAFSELVALRYRYDGGVSDNEKVWGYCVLKIQKEIRYRSDGTIYTENISTGGPIVIGLPNYNRADGTFFKLEEVPIPSPDPDDDPNDEGDPADEGGGDGNHTPIYDPIPIPDAPNLGAANAGFITMYKLGLAAINTFASDMFASTVWEAIRLFFSNPIDFLVGCMLLPFEPETGSSYYPKFGIVAFEHAYPAVSNQYKDIDCGSINISKYWGSCFDYEPYTKIQIWLPYIGYRELPVDEIMDMTVSVKYRCDCLTGDCVAFVYTGVVGQTGPQVERVIGQFYGNCGVRVPFGSVSYDSAVAASISLIGAAATTGLSAGAGAMSQTGGAVGGLIAGADAVMTDGNVRSASIGVVQGLKPNVHKGGAAGASTGYMSIQKPYIIKRIPRQNLPANYMNLKGYPSNIGGTLSQFTGLAVVDDIQLNNIPAMEDERKEIIKWLRGGVLV